MMLYDLKCLDCPFADSPLCRDCGEEEERWELTPLGRSALTESPPQRDAFRFASWLLWASFLFWGAFWLVMGLRWGGAR